MKRGFFLNSIRGLFRPVLAESHFYRTVHIEFTSRCNLRCVFCAASRPGYEGRDMAPGILAETSEELQKLKPQSICVNGHGETTLYNDWFRCCRELMQKGLKLHIISNFARKFREEELEILAGFKSIEISCDSHDPELFSAIRRGADLETVLANIRNVVETAQRLGKPAPVLSMSCVVCDKNVLSLPNFVRFALSHGISGFNFCNLVTYSPLKNGLSVRHISEMPPSLLPAARDGLMKAINFLDNKGAFYSVQQGLLDALQEKISGCEASGRMNDSTSGGAETSLFSKKAEAPLPSVVPEETAAEAAPRNLSADTGEFRLGRGGKKQPEKTRDCLDPWSFALVQAGGDVSPCCWHPPLGAIGKRSALREILNNTQMRDLRKRLLTGDLPEYCRICPTRGWTTVKQLKKKALAYLYPATLGFLTLRAPLLELPPGRKLPVHFLEGWFPPETDNAIPVREWRNWRWSGKTGSCLLEPGALDSVLVINGGVNKELIWDQKVTVRLNHETVDEFIPVSAKFTREYVIRGNAASGGRHVILEIATDKTFIPPVADSGIADCRELGIQIYELNLTTLNTQQNKMEKGGRSHKKRQPEVIWT